MTVGEVEHSQSGSNSYDGRGSTEYPLLATLPNKVEWLRSAFSQESSLSMQEEAVRGLEQESVEMLRHIMRSYGPQSFGLDVYARANSRRFIKLHMFFANEFEPGHLDAISINALLKNYSLGCAAVLICYRTESEMEQIKEIYQAIFRVQLEVDIENYTASCRKMLLESIPAQHGDDDVVMVDRGEVKSTVISLHEDIRKTPRSALEIIRNNLAGKSREFIDAVFNAYNRKYGRPLETVLTSAQDDVLFGYELTTIMRCSVNRPKYFAENIPTDVEGN